MIKEALGKADTVEEARERALAGLKAKNKIKDTADIRYEVLEMPKAKVLGLFGGKLAVVKAFVELPDEKPAKKQPAKGDRQKAPADKKAQPEKKEKNAPAKGENTGAAAAEAAGVPVDRLEKSGNAAKAAAYITEILKELGCNDVKMTVDEKDDGAAINVEGDNLGVVIGRRGETLDALQYLASLAASKKGEGYYRVVINVGDYREKRAASLEGLAKKTAATAIRLHRSRSLEPMNPYERRIVHTAIQGVEGVTSKSIGEGSRRHVVIIPDNAERRPRGNYGRERAAYNAVPAQETEKRADAQSMPLYGRIDK